MSPLLAAAGAPGRLEVAADGLAGSQLELLAVLAALSLLPFAILMVTSFSKMAVVLSIVRSALGTQQAPPTVVLTGLAAEWAAGF